MIVKRYMVIPLLIWAGVSFGTPGAAVANLLVGLVAGWHSMHGHPAFLVAGAASRIEQAVDLQIFLSLGAISSLLAAAFLAERQRAEQALRDAESRTRRLNRVLRAIHEVHGLLAAEKNRRRLLQGVCEILLRTRGYVSIWVGEPDHDSRKVVPLAHAGIAAAFWKHAPITWDDSPLGRGPTGTAIRERRTVVFDDLANDPRFAPWRDPVVALGGASIASIPLIHQERLRGVLTVKADRPRAFDAEEVELLNDLANDIAHALQSLETAVALEELNATLERRVGERTCELSESEARLRLTQFSVDRVGDCVLWTHADGRVANVNEAACRTFGYSRDEFLRLTIPDLDADCPAAAYALFWEQIQVCGSFVLEHNLRRKSGEPFTGEVRVTYVEFDGKKYSFVLIRDITERKHAEQTRQMFAEEIHDLYNRAPCGYHSLDPEGTFLQINDTELQWLGYTREELVGRKQFSDLLTPESQRTFAANFPLFRQRGWVNDVEFDLVRKDGTLLPVLLNATAVTSPAGEFLRSRSTMFDDSKRRAVQNELRQARDAAESANRAKSVFLANMSHEIRTPLNAILGYTQLLQHAEALPVEAREKIRIINRSGAHLLDLINAVLEMSKIESGRVAVEPTTFDLHALLADLAGIFRLQSESKRLAFTVVNGDGLPRHLRADEPKLRQVLVNLLGNAFKFTERGRVELRAAVVEDGGSSWLRAEVEDTGAGIAPAEQSRLFQQFEQTSSGRQLQSGSGLGLAISRQFARLMGGDLTVTSREGHGSTFCLKVPVLVAGRSAAGEPAEIRHVAGLAPGQPEFRILVVDDHQENRRWLGEFLRLAGFLVREVADGEEAIRVGETWKPHLVLTDLRMPGMDGFEVTRRIKAGPRGRETVVVVLTAAVFQEEQEAILAAGAAEVLAKPIDKDFLLGRIAAHLPVRFLYTAEPETPAPANGSSAGAPLTPQALANVPATLRSALHGCVLRGDSPRLNALLQDVARLDATLGDRLRALARNYDYDTLSRLLAEPSL